MPGSRIRRTIALTPLLPLLLSPSLAAAAAAPTRPQFVERAERICRASTEANGTVLAGAEAMIRAGKLKQVAPRFGRAARVLERTAARLGQVPRPAADAARISRWLGYAKDGVARLRAIRQALGRERRDRVEALANQLLRGARQANGAVAGFDFDYCRMNPARFV